jgi:hypothetical protein
MNCPSCQHRLPVWRMPRAFQCAKCKAQVQVEGRARHFLATAALWLAFGFLITFGFAQSESTGWLVLVVGLIALVSLDIAIGRMLVSLKVTSVEGNENAAI